MDDVNTNSPDIIINKVLQILQTDKPVYIDIIHCITNDYIEYKIQDVGQANINDMTNGNIKNNSDMINIINRYIANLIKGPFDEKLVIRLIVNVDTAHNIALKHIQFIENPVDINNCQGGFSLYKLSLQQVNENKRVAREEAARQLADEKQRIVQEDAARLLAAEEARLAGEKQRLADEETARQLAAAEEAHKQSEEEENNWKDVEDTLISDFQTILYRIYEHLISIKTGINTKTDINSIITHLNVINGSYKSLNENFYENKNVIRNWQTQSNKVDNTDLIQETLMDFGEILPNYTANPNEKKSYPDIRLIISLQELIYKLMQYFGMDKPETPFVKKLIEAKTLLLKDAVKASAATHTDHPIKINGEIVAHSVKIIDELHLYITKHVSELRTEPLLLSIADIKTISDGLKQLIYHLQHPHGNQLDKHVSSPLVTRLDDCIKYITELITSYTTVRPIAGGKLSRKKHTKPSKQTKRRDRNRKQQTHNKRTKFRRNQTRRKSK